MSQHDKIIAMMSDMTWHCQREFWNISKSPHKRRAEIEERGYKFGERPCVHGTPASKDFIFTALKTPKFRYEERNGVMHEIPA